VTPRYAAKRDANEPELVKRIKKRGATVDQLDGTGTPDLLIGYHGINALAEVKDPTRIPSEQNLNEHQIRWHATWKGQVTVIKTERDVDRLLDRMAVMGAILRESEWV
jgi:hypothetical protein